MKEKHSSPRSALMREVVVFQIKLMADGLRDLVLMPLSLAAAAFGMARSGEDPEVEFRRVMALGRETEEWIDLFGHESGASKASRAASIDQLLDRAGAAVREQHRKGGLSDQASQVIEKALAAAQRSLGRNPAAADDPPEGQ